MHRRLNVVLASVLCLAAYVAAKEQIVIGSKSSLSVLERDLVTKRPSYSSILKEHDRYHKSGAHTKTTKGMVLAYVTPWNNHGYDIAKIFQGKFTHISPVWYTVKSSPGGTYSIHGSHDVDQPWIAAVRGTPPKTRVVPRIQFDPQTWDQNAYVHLISNAAAATSLAHTIASELDSQNLDGFVLECAAPGHIAPFLSAVREAMGKEKQIFLVIPPGRADGYSGLGKREFDAVVDLVDGLSLMTYDFTPMGSGPGPNSPIDWVEENVVSLTTEPTHRAKILLGMNLYGVDWADSGHGEHVVGKNVLELLALHTPKLKWEDDIAEHVFEYEKNGAKHHVYYPSLKSIDERIALAEEMGTGLSLWEIGQGLDYFYDLF